MLLTRKQLSELVGELAEMPTLTVYIDGAAEDPAKRTQWRIAVRDEIDRLRDSLGEIPRAERDAFDRAVKRLESRLRSIRGALRAPGWMIVIAGGDVHYSSALPARVATEAHWRHGPWVGPYARMLKQEDPVVVALIDSRSASVYEYASGRLRSVATKHALRRGGEEDHMGKAPAPGFHSGTRGATQTERMQQARVIAAQRLTSLAAEVVVQAAAETAWIVIGGARGSTVALRGALPEPLRDRSIVFATLPRRARRDAIVKAAQRGAEALRRERDRVVVDGLLERTGAHTTAVVGPLATLDALEHGAAAEVLMTPWFLQAHASEAEQAIERALGEGAAVAVVSDVAAATLDERGGGIGAQLRFALHAPPPAPEVVTSAG
ncbi:MAG TPA: hypothetical protein VHB25_07490 [Gemmatimonadaceae bacterium]|nr:hypothetical protein [Gemmatimonadaceae bacterium]